MPKRQTKLWPTPQNSQGGNDAEWPLITFLQYFQDLASQLPREDRQSAVIGPIGGPNGISVWYQRTVDQAEIDRERVALVDAELRQRVARGEGATADELAGILQRLQALA